MNPQETAQVVAEIALYDNREVDPAVIAGWHRMIGDLDFADARAAVIRHFRDSAEYLKPAHVRGLVKVIRADRLRNSDLAVPPADPSDEAGYRRALRGITRRIGDGNAPFTAIGAAAMTSSPTDAYRDARRAMGARRDNRVAVLAYADLAQRLTEPPLNFEHPHQWNGYVPPETHDQKRNDSDRRAALAEIVAEAHRRDEEDA